jgi:hypothetical protein
MPEYDGTRWRLIPQLTMHPQDAYCHEVPLYGAMKEGEWAFCVHGPQDPRDIDREPGVRLPTRGPNPNTDAVRLPFGLRDDGFEYAKPVPWVHHVLVEWRILGESLNGGPMFGHLEGGMTIFQVARKVVWYIGSWIAQEQAGYGLDPKARKVYRGKSINVNGKLIFVRRVLTLPSGEQYETGEIVSAVAGGPSAIKVSHVGHPDYPKFPNVVMKIDSAKFNAMRYPLLTPCLNRQGFLCSHNRHIEIMNGVAGPADLPLASDWDSWNVGDDLMPHADVQAPIQTQHTRPAPPEPEPEPVPSA